MGNVELWLKGLLAAAIAGAANGVITGFAAMGIDPVRFNLRAGLLSTLAIAAVSALMSAIIGAAAYLKQSPLPGAQNGLPAAFGDGRDRDRDRVPDAREYHDDRMR